MMLCKDHVVICEGHPHENKRHLVLEDHLHGEINEIEHIKSIVGLRWVFRET